MKSYNFRLLLQLLLNYESIIRRLCKDCETVLRMKKTTQRVFAVLKLYNIKIDMMI
jgi:hypothetical protein